MYKKIETAKYFNNPENIIFDYRNKQGIGQIRLDDGDIYYLKDVNYPKYFKYEEPFDAHFCGDWVEVGKEEYNEYIRKRIEEEYAIIERLKKELV